MKKVRLKMVIFICVIVVGSMMGNEITKRTICPKMGIISHGQWF